MLKAEYTAKVRATLSPWGFGVRGVDEEASPVQAVQHAQVFQQNNYIENYSPPPTLFIILISSATEKNSHGARVNKLHNYGKRCCELIHIFEF